MHTLHPSTSLSAHCATFHPLHLLTPPSLLRCPFPPLRSSYGSVFKALDKRDGLIVAIKVLEVENEDTVELMKEINILKECNSKMTLTKTLAGGMPTEKSLTQM